jgi:chemotaxis protein methyltransferase CheR
MGFKADVLGLPQGAGVLLRDLIHERTGVFFDNGKADLLVDKISPLVIERGFSSFLDYYYLLKYDETAQHEWRKVMDTISVPETYFWREMDQVHALVDIILPQWFEKEGSATFKIWSAACATGEEPLTIALALNEAGWFGRLPIEIDASDASPRAIEKARAGLYRERSFRTLAPDLRDKYFAREDQKSWRVDSGLQRRINWQVANLRDKSEVARLAKVQAIFCRNVFIYFSDQAVSETLNTFAASIRSPGYLFVATSESLLRLTNKFVLEEIGNGFVYLKNFGADESRLPPFKLRV